MNKAQYLAMAITPLFLFAGCGTDEATPAVKTETASTPAPTENLSEEQKESLKPYIDEEKDPLVELLSPSTNETSEELMQSLDKEEFLAEWETQNGVLIDLRTPAEIAETPMLDESAQNFNYYDPNFAENFRDIDKEAVYFIYCAHGNRSQTVINSMEKAGFTNVFELKGGLAAGE